MPPPNHDFVMSDDIERAAGQMLIAGFEGSAPEPPEAIAEALREGRIGGVIQFSRNVEDLEQVVGLNRRIHELGAEGDQRPFVAVDQEGGPVMRLREGMTAIPPMREVGESGDPGHIADVSQVIAGELRALGFNLNFAPVLDVDTHPDNPIIAERAFGDDPQFVARAGGAFLYGHNVAGVIPCGKHFPGHGDTETDSHHDLPVLMHAPQRLEQIELIPFETAVGAGIPMIMTAHLLLPALDTVRPATFSPEIIDGLLREQLGFDGVVVTDDLEMQAVADRYDIEEMIELGLATSVDLFLVCHTEEKWRRAHAAIVERAEADEAVRERVVESARRVSRLKTEFFGHQPHPWTPADDWRDRVGSDDHRRRVDRQG